jgi:hypothetical protein
VYERKKTKIKDQKRRKMKEQAKIKREKDNNNYRKEEVG